MTVRAQELDRARDAHVAALNANDADAWVACFAPDRVQMPPNDPPKIGTANIRAWSSGILAAFDTKFTLGVDELERTGDDCRTGRSMRMGLFRDRGDRPGPIGGRGRERREDRRDDRGDRRDDRQGRHEDRRLFRRRGPGATEINPRPSRRGGPVGDAEI